VTERDAMLPLSDSSVAASCVLTLMSAVGGERPHVDSAVDDGNAQRAVIAQPGANAQNLTGGTRAAGGTFALLPSKGRVNPHPTWVEASAAHGPLRQVMYCLRQSSTANLSHEVAAVELRWRNCPQGFCHRFRFFGPYGRRQSEQTVVIHPIEAAARKVKNGDYIRAFDGRGAFEGKAQLSTDAREELAVANLGYWPSLNRWRRCAGVSLHRGDLGQTADRSEGRALFESDDATIRFFGKRLCNGDINGLR
jgi:hypothetical protein